MEHLEILLKELKSIFPKMYRLTQYKYLEFNLAEIKIWTKHYIIDKEGEVIDEGDDEDTYLVTFKNNFIYEITNLYGITVYKKDIK